LANRGRELLVKDSIYEGLNDEQREAVSWDEGPCLLVAGPGSGKTTVITRRIARLIMDGVNPSSILNLTFTRAAAQMMIERAKRLTPEAEDVVGGTFHSIAHKLIKENASVFRLPDTLSIADPSDVTQIFKRITAERSGTGENPPPYKTISKIYSFAMNTRRTLEDVVYDLHTDYVYALKFIEEVGVAYKQYKKDRRMLDYDDLLGLWAKMLQHPIVGQAIRDRFKYVLVDEHQDSNALQNEIIAGLGRNIMPVGDPAQSIYAFRGSAPRAMFSFLDLHPDTKTINLNLNYRSSSEIIDVANAIDGMMEERFDRTLVSSSGTLGKLPKFVTMWDGFEEADYVADTILENKAQGTPLHEQAVLVRSMNAARLIEGALVKRRIPYKVFGGIKISEASHIKDFLSLARVSVNQFDEPAWLRVLCMAKGVGEKKAIAIYNAVIGGGLIVGDPAPVALRMTKDNPDIRKLMDAFGVMSGDGDPVTLLDKGLKAADDVFKNVYGDEWKNRKMDIETVITMAEKFATLDEYLSMMTIDLSVDKMSESTGTDESERPLTLSTVHSAKGNEWDIVYIPSFVNGHMPSARATEPQEIEEEKRILFVAMTRPRKKLIVTRPTVGRQGMIAAESAFQAPIIENFEKVQIGRLRQPQSFGLGMDAYDDIHIDIFD
jgi:DNA helicase-2/ATP-dependent DNA helicase PcrA